MTVTLTNQSQLTDYAAVEDKGLTRFPVWPTSKYRYQMYKEACDVAIAVNGRYEWAGEFGLLAIVTGANKYTSLANKVYVNPTEPPAYNTLINQGTSDYQQDKKSAEHEVLRKIWATYIGA